MRCDATAGRVGGCESACSAAPVGGAGAAAGPADDEAANAARATPATSRALPKRRTTLRVEDVDVADVDGDRNVVVEPELRSVARRESSDEVRPGRGDALALLFLRLVVGMSLVQPHHLRVYLEMRDRLRSQRLEQLELGGQRRQIGPVLRRIEILGADSDNDRPIAGAAHLRVPRQRLI